MASKEVSRRGLLSLAAGAALVVALGEGCSGYESEDTQKMEEIVLGPEGTRPSIAGWGLKRFRKGEAEYESAPIDRYFLSNSGQFIIDDKQTGIKIGYYKTRSSEGLFLPRLSIDRTTNQQLVDFTSASKDPLVDTDVVVLENSRGRGEPEKYFRITPVEAKTFLVEELERIS